MKMGIAAGEHGGDRFEQLCGRPWRVKGFADLSKIEELIVEPFGSPAKERGLPEGGRHELFPGDAEQGCASLGIISERLRPLRKKRRLAESRGYEFVLCYAENCCASLNVIVTRLRPLVEELRLPKSGSNEPMFRDVEEYTAALDVTV
jgi:hypothetical protein